MLGRALLSLRASSRLLPPSSCAVAAVAIRRSGTAAVRSATAYNISEDHPRNQQNSKVRRHEMARRGPKMIDTHTRSVYACKETLYLINTLWWCRGVQGDPSWLFALPRLVLSRLGKFWRRTRQSWLQKRKGLIGLV